MDKNITVDWNHVSDLYEQRKFSREEIIRAATEEKHRLVAEGDMMIKDFLLFSLIDMIVGFCDYEWRFPAVLEEFQSKLTKCSDWTHSTVMRLKLADTLILYELQNGYFKLKNRDIEISRAVVSNYLGRFDSPTRISGYFFRSIVYLMMGLIGDGETDTLRISDESDIMHKIEEQFDICSGKKCFILTIEVKDGKENYLFI